MIINIYIYVNTNNKIVLIMNHIIYLCNELKLLIT